MQPNDIRITTSYNGKAVDIDKDFRVDGADVSQDKTATVRVLVPKSIATEVSDPSGFEIVYELPDRRSWKVTPIKLDAIPLQDHILVTLYAHLTTEIYQALQTL